MSLAPFPPALLSLPLLPTHPCPYPLYSLTPTQYCAVPPSFRSLTQTLLKVQFNTCDSAVVSFCVLVSVPLMKTHIVLYHSTAKRRGGGEEPGEEDSDLLVTLRANVAGGGLAHYIPWERRELPWTTYLCTDIGSHVAGFASTSPVQSSLHHTVYQADLGTWTVALTIRGSSSLSPKSPIPFFLFTLTLVRSSGSTLVQGGLILGCWDCDRDCDWDLTGFTLVLFSLIYLDLPIHPFRLSSTSTGLFYFPSPPTALQLSTILVSSLLPLAPSYTPSPSSLVARHCAPPPPVESADLRSYLCEERQTRPRKGKVRTAAAPTNHQAPSTQHRTKPDAQTKQLRPRRSQNLRRSFPTQRRRVPKPKTQDPRPEYLDSD